MVQRSTFLVVILLIANVINAQTKVEQGYILLQENDTLKGRIIQLPERVMSKRIYFMNESGAVTSYRANEDKILGYGYSSGNHFISTPDDRLFLRKILAGDYSLYESNYVFSISTPDSLFAFRGSRSAVVYREGRKFKKKSNEWKRPLYILCDGCEGAKLMTDKLPSKSREGLIDLFKELNSCNNSNFSITPSVGKKPIIFDFSLGVEASFLGYSLPSDVNITDRSRPFSPSIAPEVGARLPLTLGMNSYLMRIGLAYSQNTLTSTTNTRRSIAGILTRESLFEATSNFKRLLMPITFDYPVFNKNNISIRPQVGLYLTYYLSHSFTREEFTISDTGVLTSVIKEEDSSLGLSLGIGYGIDIQKELSNRVFGIRIRNYLTGPLTSDSNEGNLSLSFYASLPYSL